MIALTRFQIAGYVRSLRALYPLIATAALTLLVFLQRPQDTELAFGSLGDVMAFMVPIWAWTSRALLDTQPDTQRALTALAVPRHPLAGLLAAYTANLALALVAVPIPLLHAVTTGVAPASLPALLALLLLSCAAATVLGAWTSRAIIPRPATASVALLGALTGALLLGLTPASWLAPPILDWVSAARHGPSAFAGAFPALALHLALWTAVAAAGYLSLAHRRP
ncbi:hypothetical protein [Actinomadura macrotermitis]|uniref:ABC transporter permease n=1 Tax=Actinomadura macrotermitis TaxID=2585200 RepID=A0A7K0BP91_9ACTN|nr:hypothetical protein [Actinomadura macrotermitis]MQY02995.1 hypothetical protein [Actinomadura macrotermitis]